MSTQPSIPGAFYFRLKKGDFELELSSPDRRWVDAKVAELHGALGIEPGEAAERSPGPDRGNRSGSKAVSLAEHVRAVAPSGGVEHVLAVGYYLERHSGLRAGFRRRDLADAFAVLRYQHSNPGVPIAAARRKGLLMDAGEHEKMLLTKTAEQWVAERLSIG